MGTTINPIQMMKKFSVKNGIQFVKRDCTFPRGSLCTWGSEHEGTDINDGGSFLSQGWWSMPERKRSKQDQPSP